MRSFSGLVPWEVMMEEVEWLRLVSDAVVGMTGKSGLRRVLSWGAAGTAIVSVLPEPARSERIIVLEDPLERVHAEAVHPGSLVMSVAGIRNGLPGSGVDLAVMDPAEESGMTLQERLRLCRSLLSPTGRLLLLTMTEQQLASNPAQAYFPVLKRNVDSQDDTAGKGRLSPFRPDSPLTGGGGLMARMNQAAACGLNMTWMEEVRGGAQPASPRLAKALRAYGHRQMHLTGEQGYLEGLDRLETDRYAPAHRFAACALTLVWLTSQGNGQALPGSDAAVETVYPQSA